MLEQLKNFLAQYIEATIYIGQLPPSPDHAVMLHQYAGRPATDTLYSMPGIQITTRGANYTQAETTAYLIDQYLSWNNSAATISGAEWIVDIIPNHDPYSLGNDDLHRTRFVQNFIAQRKR